MVLADIYNVYSHNHPNFLECGERMLSLIRNYMA